MHTYYTQQLDREDFLACFHSSAVLCQALDSFLYCIQNYGDLKVYWSVGRIDLMRDLRMKHKTEFNEHQLRRQQNSSDAKDDDVNCQSTCFCYGLLFFDSSKEEFTQLDNIFWFLAAISMTGHGETDKASALRTEDWWHEPGGRSRTLVELC